MSVWDGGPVLWGSNIDVEGFGLGFELEYVKTKFPIHDIGCSLFGLIFDVGQGGLFGALCRELEIRVDVAEDLKVDLLHLKR